jgi:hypothetical protein
MSELPGRGVVFSEIRDDRTVFERVRVNPELSAANPRSTQISGVVDAIWQHEETEPPKPATP